MNQMDWTHISTTTGPNSADVTTESVLAAVRELRAMLPPPPTEEQRRWARANGFPGYPGFKVGVKAWEKLKREFAPAPDGVDVLGGVPVAVDQGLDPLAVVSAEAEWAKRQPGWSLLS